MSLFIVATQSDSVRLMTPLETSDLIFIRPQLLSLLRLRRQSSQPYKPITDRQPGDIAIHGILKSISSG